MHPVVIVFAICALACIVAHGAILLSVIGRRSSVVDSNVPRPRLLVEVVWALVPAVALALVLTATWTRVRENARANPAVMMKIAR
jgi:heme/copper-type cytochrome/quinol oxidase subunit 2